MFLVFFLFSKIVFSQTTYNIGYANNSNLEGLTPTVQSCNVFTIAQSIGGFYNYSLAGGVQFNPTSPANGISLPTYPQSNTGTAYYIAFNFLPNYKYSISITTSGGDGYVYLNTSVVPNLTSFPTSSNTSCAADALVNGYSTVGY